MRVNDNIIELRRATAVNSNFFYEVKKTVLKGYIEKIWGWDEAFQLQFHKENYNAANTSVIYVDGEAAGTVEIKESEKEIFISSLYLLPAWQGKGIGTSVINRWLDKAAAGGTRVSLEVLKLNVGAQRLYERLGFAYKGEDEVKFLMYKDAMNEQDKSII